MMENNGLLLFALIIFIIGVIVGGSKHVRQKMSLGLMIFVAVILYTLGMGIAAYCLSTWTSALITIAAVIIIWRILHKWPIRSVPDLVGISVLIFAVGVISGAIGGIIHLLGGM